MPIPTLLPIGCGSRTTSILRRRSYGSQSRRGLIRSLEIPTIKERNLPKEPERMGNRSSRLALLASLILLAVAPAYAEDQLDNKSLDELKALVQKLEKRVDQLESERNHPPPKQQQMPSPRRVARPQRTAPPAQQPAAQTAAGQAQQQAAQTAAEQAQQAAAGEVKAALAPPGKPGGSFRIPGTDTVVRIYGFAKLNAISDLTS